MAEKLSGIIDPPIDDLLLREQHPAPDEAPGILTEVQDFFAVAPGKASGSAAAPGDIS